MHVLKCDILHIFALTFRRLQLLTPSNGKKKSNHHPLLFPFEGVSPGSVDFEVLLPSIFNPYPVNITVIYFLGLAYVKVHF